MSAVTGRLARAPATCSEPTIDEFLFSDSGDNVYPMTNQVGFILLAPRTIKVALLNENKELVERELVRKNLGNITTNLLSFSQDGKYFICYQSQGAVIHDFSATNTPRVIENKKLKAAAIDPNNCIVFFDHSFRELEFLGADSKPVPVKSSSSLLSVLPGPRSSTFYAAYENGIWLWDFSNASKPVCRRVLSTEISSKYTISKSENSKYIAILDERGDVTIYRRRSAQNDSSILQSVHGMVKSTQAKMNTMDEKVDSICTKVDCIQKNILQFHEDFYTVLQNTDDLLKSVDTVRINQVIANILKGRNPERELVAIIDRVVHAEWENEKKVAWISAIRETAEDTDVIRERPKWWKKVLKTIVSLLPVGKSFLEIVEWAKDSLQQWKEG